MNLIQHDTENVYFHDGTPYLLQNVLLTALHNNTRVHILTGDPLSGMVQPSLNSVGRLELSGDKKPMLILRSRYWEDSPDKPEDTAARRRIWLRTDKILKIINADTSELLFQSYECKSAPLQVITTTLVSPYGEINTRTVLRCENPETEIPLPDNVDYINVCNFLYGKLHALPCKNK